MWRKKEKSNRKQQLYNYGALFQAVSFFNLKWNIELTKSDLHEVSRKPIQQHFKWTNEWMNERELLRQDAISISL